MKTTKELTPGVRYPGYGFVNDYGEFQFQPSEVGSRQGRKKLVKGSADFTLYKTEKLIIFHCTIERKLNLMERVKKAMSLLDELIKIFREYEI